MEKKIDELVDELVNCAACMWESRPRAKWDYCIRNAALKILPVESHEYIRDAHRSDKSRASALNFKKLRSAAQWMIGLEVPREMPHNMSPSDYVPKTLLLAGCALEEVIKLFTPADIPFVQPKPILGEEFIPTENIWGYCGHCWRIVFIDKKSPKRKTWCDLHKPPPPPKTKGAKTKKSPYHNMRRLLDKRKKAMLKENSKYSNLLNRVHTGIGLPTVLLPVVEEFNSTGRKEYLPCRPENYCGTIDHEGGAFPLPGYKVTLNKHDIEKLWEVFPYTKSYILEHGGDPTDGKSSFYTLQRTDAGDSIDGLKIDESIKKLIDIMVQDFGLANYWLKNAEIWLRFLSKYQKKHGGPREGAGRKKSKI